MIGRVRTLGRYAPVAAAIVLPAILLYSSFRTFWELEQMKSVYLRNRAAAVAARLESMPPATSPEDIVERLSSEEAALIGLKLFEQPSPDDSEAVAAIWHGHGLFVTEDLRDGAVEVFRAYVPFHRQGRMHIAQLDLDKAAADFLLLHARHNILIASVSGTAIVLLAWYVVWTFRQRAREEARALRTLHLAHLGQLAAVLAHEIRNPLASVKGFVQLALEGSDVRTASLLKPAVAEARRIEQLVNDLMQYGRPPEPKPAGVNWDELARDLIAGASDARLEVAPKELHWVTDAGMVKQILQNLIRNALDAIGDRPDGRVRVSTHKDGGMLTITVEDNGPGIARDERERVFEAFYTTKSFGSGLGLPTARKLAGALGGVLRLEASESGGVRAVLQMPSRMAEHAREKAPAWN
jgi:signal transduction histidine kinase